MPAKGQFKVARRICRQCHLKPCQKAEHQFCSEACFRASRRVVRPLCPVCLTGRLKSARAKTCSKACGAKTRDNTSRMVGIRAMWKQAHANHLKRLAARLKAEVDALDRSVTPAERAKVLARVYRRGYSNGASAAYDRYVGRHLRRARLAAAKLEAAS